MELRQMIYFKELSECLNLPAAARALYITPQALSKSMRVLAREFDTEIFYRDQGKLRLTTFGQALLSEVTVLLSQINAMEYSPGSFQFRLHRVQSPTSGDRN